MSTVPEETRIEQGRFDKTLQRLRRERAPLLRCHRQYLVNVDRIRKIHFVENGLAEISTQGGHTISISRRFLAACVGDGYPVARRSRARPAKRRRCDSGKRRKVDRAVPLVKAVRLP